MKKFLSVILICTLCALTLTSCIYTKQDYYESCIAQLEYIERETYVHLPSNAELIECTDSHGGFHGDGTMEAVITLPDNEETEKFLEEIKIEWYSPSEETRNFYDELNRDYLYGESFISYSDTAYYFFRDRYYEQNGKKTTYSRNMTVAAYYPETRTLKFLEVDT